MSNGKIRLFLSHASEDKDDFVRPLAEALREEFEVWYDEYSLLVGPGLLGQISKGLRQCQYGIVVLSKHFFEKKWPRSELDGLFDLEPADQSLILPIWHAVTHDEVSQFSPILASRGATRSQLGIRRVVSDLKRSIDAGERTKQISSPVGRHIRAYLETAGAQEKYKQWAWSQEGITAVWREWNRIEEITKGILAAHGETGFNVAHDKSDYGNWSTYITVTGPSFMLDTTKLDSARADLLQFNIQQMAVNSIINARCWRRDALKSTETCADYVKQPDNVDQLTFKPYCTKDAEAVWQTLDGNTIRTEELVEDGLLLLFDLANKGIRGEL